MCPGLEQLERLAAGDMSADRVTLEQHVASCVSCRAALREMQANLAIAARLGDGVGPEGCDPTRTLNPVAWPERITEIGPFCILETLGEGGFGVVYLAEQTAPVRRRVALKVIKPGMDSARVIARFEAERQALAMMDHPNIAKVLDAGTTDKGARPYFVMEHVPGESITAYADRHKLSTRARIELFIPVCEAVQHAHTKGIIHRDLKPSNVLVVVREGQQPFPKVIDFGVAKALHGPLGERTIFTEQGQLIGTPEYMSPEQAEMGPLDIDTRSDVYSLGVMLYELFTGARPFDLRNASLIDMVQIIRERDPIRPSTRLTSSGDALTRIADLRRTRPDALTRELKRELEWIPLKALKKDRTERYQTAADLAKDLRNYLDGLPLIAGPDSAQYRMRKFAKRHRSAIAAGSLILAALGVGMILAVAGLAEARREREKAHQRADDLQAVVAFQQSLLANIDASRMGETIVRSVKGAVQLLPAATPESPRAQEGTLEDLLEKISATSVALDVLDDEILTPAATTIEREFGTRPVVAASLHQSLALLYLQLAIFDKATTHQERALELRRKHLGERDIETIRSLVESCDLAIARSEYPAQRLTEAARIARETLGPDHRLTLRAEHLLGEVLFGLGDFAQGEPLLQRTLEARRRLFGPDDPYTLGAVHEIAHMLWDRGDFARSEALFREAEAARTRVLGADHPHTLFTQGMRARVLASMGRYAEAESLIRAVIDGTERRRGAAHPNTCVARRTLGSILARRGDLRAGEAVLREAYLGIERSRGKTSHSTGIALCELAVVQVELGRFAEADESMTQALNVLGAVFGSEHWFPLSKQVLVVSLRRKQGRLHDARDLCERSVRGLERALGARHPAVLRVRHELGLVLLDLGMFREAESTFTQALATSEQAVGADHPDALNCREGLGRTQTMLGLYTEADATLRGVVEGRRRLLGDAHPDTLQARNSMSRLRIYQGRMADARSELQEVIEDARRLLGDTHPDTLTAIQVLGDLFYEEAQLDKANSSLHEALEGRRRTLGDDHPDTLYSMLTMALLLDDQGAHDKALEYCKAALEGRRRVLGRDHPGTFAAMAVMGSLLWSMGERGDAESYLKQALEGRRRVLGERHPATLDSLNDIGFVRVAVGRPAEAEPYFTQSLEGRRHLFGDEHTDTLESLVNLGGLLNELGRHPEALKLLHDAEPTARRLWVSGNRKWLGNHLVKLGAAHAGMGEFAQGEALLLEAHQILAEGFGEKHERTIKVAGQLVNLYDKWLASDPGCGRDAAVAKWRSRLAELEAQGDVR